MRILYITDLSDRKANGVTTAVVQLLNSIGEYADVKWLNLNENKFDVNSKVQRVSIKNWMNETPDIVVFEDPFNNLRFCKLAKMLRKENIPYIISPHGCFHKMALKNKRLKKQVAMQTVFKSFFQGCLAVQYLTDNERDNSYGINERIVIPNGIENVHHEHIKTQAKRLFFIGRKAVNNKGLDLLLEACSKSKNMMESQKTVLNIYGSIHSKKDEDYLNKKIAHDALEKVVVNHGPIFGKEKDEVYQNGDVFIQASRHEGLPMSILEALTYGCPVAVTTGTNFGESVKNYDAGWTCETTVEGIATMLSEIMNCTQTEILKKSQNAITLAAEYSWDKVSQLTIKEYEQLLKRGANK